MAFDAGSIEASLTLDTSEFQAGLDQAKADADEFASGRYTVTVDADTAELDGKVDDADTKLDELGEKHVDPSVGLDDDDARAKLDDLSARIMALQTEASLLKVDTDTGAARTKITQIQEALEGLGADASELHFADVFDPAQVDGMSDALDRLDQKLQSVNTDMAATKKASDDTNDSAGPEGLLGTLLSLAPALETVGAVGAAGLGATAAAAAAAAVGVGAFALAAGPALDEVKASAASMLATFQEANTSATLPVLQSALALLPRVFDLITPLVRSTATALDGLEQSVASSLGSPFWSEFTQFLGGEAGAAITTFGHLAIGAGTALAGLTEAFAPLIADVESGLNRLATDMDTFGQRAATSGGIASFISYVEKEAPLVLSTLEALGHDIVLIAQDAAPVGPVLLEVVDAAARLLGDLLQLNPTLTSFAIGIGSTYLGVSRLLGPLGGLSGVAKTLPEVFSSVAGATSLGSAGIAGVATASTGAIGTLARFVATGSLAVPGLDLLTAALLQSTGTFSNFDGAADKANKTWSEQFVASLPAGVNAVQAVKQELSDLADQTSRYGSVLQQTAAEQAKGITPTNAQFAAYQNAGNQVDFLNSRTSELSKLLPGLVQQQSAAAAATQAAAQAMTAAQTPAQLLATDEANLKQANSTLATSISSVSSAMAGLDNYFTTADGDANNVTLAVGNLTSAFKTNGSSLAQNTVAGATNRNAVDAVSSAIESQISTMAQQHQSIGAINTVLGQQVTSLNGVLAQAGLSTSAIAAYDKQLGLTPSQVDTALTASGYTAALSQVSSLNAQIAAIPASKTVTITIKQNGTTATANTSTGQITVPAASGAVMAWAAGGVGPGFVTHGPTLVGEGNPKWPEYVIPTDPQYSKNTAALTHSLLKATNVRKMATGGVLPAAAGTATSSPGGVVNINHPVFYQPVDWDHFINRTSFALASGIG